MSKFFPNAAAASPVVPSSSVIPERYASRKCKIPGCCTKRAARSDFCEAHPHGFNKCYVISCKSERDERGVYCKEHVAGFCSIIWCNNGRLSALNEFCIDHPRGLCRTRDCRTPRPEGGPFCREHALLCSAWACPMPRNASGGIFCDEHASLKS